MIEWMQSRENIKVQWLKISILLKTRQSLQSNLTVLPALVPPQRDFITDFTGSDMRDQALHS